MVRNIELEQLVINKLTQEQFDNIEVKNPDELYFVTDAEIDGGKGAQVEEMPEATEMNAGQIVQYVGETIPDVEATATIAQTVGNSLTDLKVDAKKFAKASGLTEAGSLEFVADVYIDYGQVLIIAGNCPWFMSGTAEAIINAFNEKYGSFNDFQYTGYIVYQESSDSFLFCPNWDPDNGGLWISCTKEELESFGFQFNSNVLQNGDFNEYFYSPGNGITINWKKDAIDVGINQYGITYSGTPSNGDTIKVDYTPFVGGYEKGYFYVNQAQLSEPTVTIEQTVGNSLSNLSVDIEKFMEAEQPAGDCGVKFTAATENTHTTYVTQNGDVSFSGDISKLLKAKDLEHILPNGGVIHCGLHGDSVDDFYIGRELGWGDLIITISELEEYGIHFDGTYSVGAYATWSYDENTDVFVINWSKDSNNVELKQYGISYSGQPSAGDTITVNYITPQIKDYNWNQINVQPASKSNGGIEWVTKLDLPANYPESYRHDCRPIWSIPGGVPDGTYEFYLETLCGTAENEVLSALRHYTVKATVTFSNMDESSPRATGVLSYVLDGSWTGDANLRIPMYAKTYWNLFKKHKTTGDLYFYSSQRPFASAAPVYVNSTKEIPEIFKITALKNINTGDLYYPQGVIYDGTNELTQYQSVGGNIELCELIESVNYPSYYDRRTLNSSNIHQYIAIPNALNTPIGAYANYQELTICMETTSGGKYHAIITNYNNSCSVKVLEYLGDLANVQIGYSSEHSDYGYIYLNNENIESLELTISASGVANTQHSLTVYGEERVQISHDSFNAITEEKIGSVVNSENINTVLQYKHESTEDYTQGYFYKAVGETSIAPTSVDVTYIGQEGIQITVNDPDALVEKLSQLSGWDKNSIIEYINYGWYWWQYTENYIQWDLLGSYYDAELVNCFTVTPVENLDNGILTFNLSNFSPSHEIITNGRWEQVNVQPASNTVQVTEMPEASEENVGKILQYIGTPTSEYDQGYFYKCTADGWVQVNVQPSSGGGGEAPSELPNLTGNEGRFLSNNGSELEWADVPTSLPAQEGHSGKYLTTDGENASWVEIELPESTDGVELPDQTGNSGKFLTTDGTNLSWAEVSSGGGTVSGDYLPLSGGTLTGPLKFENAMGFSGDITLKAENWGAYGGDRFFIENAVIVVDGVRPSSSGWTQLGACKEPENQIYPEGEFFRRVCTKALNNGTWQDDIIVPEKSGTLALIEDIEAIMGDLSSALDTINGEEI